MKIKPRQIHGLNTGIFPAKVLFSTGFTYDDIIKELKKQKSNEWVEALKNDKSFIDSGKNFALKRESKDGRLYFFIIFIDTFQFTDYWYCKLAHEILHICQFLLPDLLDRDREYECEAYLHTHLMEQALKALRGK